MKRNRESSGLVRLRSERQAPVPVSRKKTGAQMLVIQRVKKSATEAVARLVGEPGMAEEVARVIERHDDHDDAAKEIDRFEAGAFDGDGFGQGGHLARSLSRRCACAHLKAQRLDAFLHRLPDELVDLEGEARGKAVGEHPLDELAGIEGHVVGGALGAGGLDEGGAEEDLPGFFVRAHVCG